MKRHSWCYHGDIILKRGNNLVFLCLKIYWNWQVFDLIHASGHFQAILSKSLQTADIFSRNLSNPFFKSKISLGYPWNYNMNRNNTCKKIPCYMRDSACRWLIVENFKVCWRYVKYFWIFPRERNFRILIGLFKYVFTNHPIMFLNRDNKTKLVPGSFSYFLEILWEKNKF